MLTTLWVLLALAPAPPLTLYVGPQVKDGFVDIDAGVVDSIADIKGQLAGTGLRLVASEAEATVKLYVLSRERFAAGDSFSTGTGVAVAPGVAAGPWRPSKPSMLARGLSANRDFAPGIAEAPLGPACFAAQLLWVSGTPDRARTYNLRLRRPTLYPVELRAHRATRNYSTRDSGGGRR